MACQTKIVITHDKEVAADLKAVLQTQVDKKQLEADLIQKFLQQLSSGVRNGSLAVTVDNGDGVAASKTLTGSTVAATNTAVINGVTFTAVASGATGNQFNVGGSDAITMANLAATINASASAGVAGVVTAAAVGAVVTVTAVAVGVVGNLIPISATGGITAGGSTLSGGSSSTNGTTLTYAFGV